jgi:ankyrin repeat protein
VVRLLLQNGADPLARNDNGDTPLHVAQKVKAVACLDALAIALTADPPKVVEKPFKGSKSQLNKTLLRAVFDDNVEGTVEALQAGGNPDLIISAEENIYLVHVVCQFGKAQILQVLVRWNVNLKVMMRNQFSCLLLAALEGRYQVIRELINAQVDLKQTNGQGQTALHLAAMGGFSKLCQTLVHADLRLLQLVCGFGRNALAYACLYDRWNVIPILKASSVEAHDCDGRTPLHLAADFAGVRSMAQLLELQKVQPFNVDCASKNSNNDTAVSHISVIPFLI